jgi:hypothetical protein
MLTPPNPTELRLAKKPPRGKDAAVHRRVYCVHYDGCLDLAVMRDWRSWTCARCLVRHERSPQGGYCIEWPAAAPPP